MAFKQDFCVRGTRRSLWWGLSKILRSWNAVGDWRDASGWRVTFHSVKAAAFKAAVRSRLRLAEGFCVVVRGSKSELKLGGGLLCAEGGVRRVTCFMANHVYTQDLVGLGVHDELHQGLFLTPCEGMLHGAERSPKRSREGVQRLEG